MAGEVVRYTVDASGPIHMLEKMEIALSHFGLAAFLSAQMGPYIKKRAKERFQGEGDDVSGTWAPLKQATVAIREGEGYSGEHPINKRTGELESWIVGNTFQVTPIPTGTSLHYPASSPPNAELAQKIATAQSGRAFPSTVARPVLGLNAADMSYFIATFHFFLETSVRG